MSVGASDRRAMEAADLRRLAELLLFAAGYFLKGPHEAADAVLTDPDWYDATVDSGLLPAAVTEAALADGDEERRQFSATFRIPGARFVPPFEQAYREGKAGGDDDAVGECLRLYAAAGYQLAPFGHVQADHAGHQARFLAVVLEQEADCLSQADPSACTVATWRAGFVAEHCQWWVQLSDRVAASGACRQLRAATALLARLAEAVAPG